MTPLYYSVHTQWPSFFLFHIKFYIQIANFCVRAFWKIYKFCNDFKLKFANFGLKLNFCTLNDPHFWESTSKKIPFFLEPTQNDPCFQRNLTPNAPYFHTPVGTCTSLSYSSAPLLGLVEDFQTFKLVCSYYLLSNLWIPNSNVKCMYRTCNEADILSGNCRNKKG